MDNLNENKIYGDILDKIKDINGNDVVIKKITLKKECQIFALLGDASKTWGADTVDISQILSQFPTFYTKIGSIILEMSEDEVMERFDLALIKKVVDPFLRRYSQEISNPLMMQGGKTDMNLQDSSPSSPTTVDGTPKQS